MPQRCLWCWVIQSNSLSKIQEYEEVHSVIYVKEKILDDETVSLDVSGVLDQGAVPILQGVCERHLASGKRVTVNLEAIVHITREGRGFIQGIRDRVNVSNLPAFMAPEGSQ